MSDINRILLKNIPIYTEDKIIENGYLLIEGEKISKIGVIGDGFHLEGVEVVEFGDGNILIPGMIDLHIHGAAGSDVMDGTFYALQTMTSSLPKEGTTSFLTTTMTSTEKNIEKALENIAAYKIEGNFPGNAEIIGVHLEGPFLSPKRAGAQHPDDIIEPDVELFKKWQKLSDNMIKLVTLAPERQNGLKLTEHLKKTGVVASIGHSDATYEEVVSAINAGVSHVTHLYNGMRGLHHREGGVVGAALLHDEVKCEMIVDGIHIAPEMVKFAYKNKGNDGVILVTDAMRAKCLGKGIYDLGGQEVTVDEVKATLKDGTLAGSILKLNHAAKNMMKFTSCTLHDIIQMTAVNPAKQLNIFDRKGSIKEGKDADLVVINNDQEIVMTFCRGKVAYSSLEG